MEPRLNGIWSLACSEPVRSQLRTSSEQASVMEFGFNRSDTGTLGFVRHTVRSFMLPSMARFRHMGDPSWTAFSSRGAPYLRTRHSSTSHFAPGGRPDRVHAILATRHMARYGQTWRHPQNRKYITYCTVRGGPSHGHS